MFSKLAPLLLPKTRTSFSLWLQQFAPKCEAIQASCEGAQIGTARITAAAVSWCRRIQTHGRQPLYQCVPDGLAHKSFLPKAENAHIACSGMPPMGQNLLPNTRATQIFLVRYTSATVEPYGLCLGRGLRERPRQLPAKSASRVQPRMRLRTESRAHLNAAHERAACPHSSSCARHGLIIKRDAHACARPRARVQRDGCLVANLCAPQR